MHIFTEDRRDSIDSPVEKETHFDQQDSSHASLNLMYHHLWIPYKFVVTALVMAAIELMGAANDYLCDQLFWEWLTDFSVYKIRVLLK